MEHKQLGQTGTMLPEIGLGTWMYRGGAEPIRRAVDLGAFHIDTAESYGTEDAVGDAIQVIRDRVFVATKVSPSHFRRRDLLRAAENSLRQLKTDRIDLYQLHWPNSDVPIAETMGAMEELVDAGKVRFIGVSNFSVEQIVEAQAVLARHRIVSNQVRYSLSDRSIEARLIPYCESAGITIIAYSPLARGLSMLKSGDRKGALSSIAARVHKTEAQVALNWCTRKEGVVAIPKANSIVHVEDNCGASGWRLSDEDIRALEESFA